MVGGMETTTTKLAAMVAREIGFPVSLDAGPRTMVVYSSTMENAVAAAATLALTLRTRDASVAVSDAGDAGDDFDAHERFFAVLTVNWSAVAGG